MLTSILKNINTNKGRDAYDLTYERPVLFLFLRHFGCVFCRESLKDVAKRQAEFEENDITLVFVHMSDNDIADKYFTSYGLRDAEHISDPETSLYASFGLLKGNFQQLFGLKNWIRGFEAVKNGTPVSIKQIGDGFQMPGVFMLQNGSVVDSFIHRMASDKPNYDTLLNCCTS